jgi:hypothetical protein
MIKNKSALILAGVLACASAVSYAKDGGGHGGNGGGAGGGAGGGDRGAASGKAGAGAVGGVSSQHISSEGAANTNSPDSANRATGLDRANDRMSAEGLAHEKAGKTLSTSKTSKSLKPDTAKKE